MKEPNIIDFPETSIIGKSMKMSLSNNLTGVLWGSFMPEKKNIKEPSSKDLYSIQVYPSESNFGPNTVFTKWAGCPVNDLQNIPEGMGSMTIPAGAYAVFQHHGPAKDFGRTFNYIMQSWLPSSGFEFDNRPQFEVMGEGYLGNDHPEAVEDVYIPIKKKS